MTPDEICSNRAASVRLDLRTIPGDSEANELPMILVSGSPDALRFLADLLLSLADDPLLPATFSLSPNGGGQFHLSESADTGMYLECRRP